MPNDNKEPMENKPKTMKTKILLYAAALTLLLAMPAQTSGQNVDVTDDISTYTGRSPWVYCSADEQVYALNNLGKYEVYGVYEYAATLDIKSDRDVEYIETTTDMDPIPYLNTQYVFKADTRIVMDFAINGHQRTWEAPFGSRNGSFWNNAFVFFSRSHNTNDAGCFNRSGEEKQGDTDIPLNTKVRIDASGQRADIYLMDNLTTPLETIITQGTVEDGVNSMYLFDLNTAGPSGDRRDTSSSFMKLYGFKVYEGDVLVMDLQPIVNSEGIPGMRDKISGRRYYSEVSTPFKVSPDGENAGISEGVTVYEGKIVVNTSDNHAYMYSEGQWIDLGSALSPIADTTYKNMEKWQFPEEKRDCFSGVSYDTQNDKNHIEDYVGTPNHEPFFCGFPTEAGRTYNVSFDFSCDEWDTYASDKMNPDNFMRAVVLNNVIRSVNFYENGNTLGGANGVLARYQLPHAATQNEKISFSFTAEKEQEYLLLQFGFVKDDTPYDFDFDHITVSLLSPNKAYSYDPYLIGLLNYIEGIEVITTTVLQKALDEAIEAARQLIGSNDTEAQREAYRNLLDALTAALNEKSYPKKGDLVFNELMAANVDMTMSPAYNFDGWIELYNQSENPLLLAGSYMSDDKSNPTKWKMPDTIGKIAAKSHKVIWMGSNDINTNQCNFKLDCEGGELYLTNAEGTTICSITYPEAISRASFARKTDGGDDWGWTPSPTPNADNATTTYVSERLKAPTVSDDGKLFDAPFTISVDIPAGATLRFTTDGTTPTLTNGITSSDGRFNVSNSVNYKFRLFAEGMIPSSVVMRSYIRRDHNYTLPIISVVTDQRYLYDDMIGVYTKGKNGRRGNGEQTPANWNMNWDRPVSFQYLLPTTNTMAVNQETDFAISGGYTRSYDVKAFKIKADRVYDNQNILNYQFFDSKPYNRNKTIQVRHGGNDLWCRIKDAAIHEIIQRSGIDLDVMSYQPTVHFINGVYKGLINVREPNNKDFAYANWGLSKEELEVYEQSPDSGAYMMVGSDETLNRIYQLSATADRAQTYEQIKQLLDIDEYTNYMAAQLFLGSWDWPDNNVKAYRKIDGGRYRFTFFDLDAAFETDGREYGESGTYLGGNFFYWIDDMQYHTFDYIPDTGNRMWGEIKFCTLFMNMLKNRTFRKKFIDTFCIMGGSVFEPQRVDKILTELGNRVRTTLSWEGTSPDYSLDVIRNALVGRVDTKAQHMKNYPRFQLNVNPQQVSLASDTRRATLFVNDCEVPYQQFSGKLFAPIKLKAIAPAGYKFEAWKKSTAQTEVVFEKQSQWKYYDLGDLGSADWTSTTFNDNAWASGPAPLGFGKTTINTTLDYGGDANHKRPTYYFRKHITLDRLPAADAVFMLDYIADDGFAVYVNGKEAGRYNLSTPNPGFSTMSDSDARSNPDTGSMPIDASLFKKGENIIAVEVHNCNYTSTDVMWDASLTINQTSAADEIFSVDAETSLPQGSDLNLIACFTPIDPSSGEDVSGSGCPPVRINEVSAANSIYVNEYFKRNDWIELYNTTDEVIDIAGMYLSDNPDNPMKYQIGRTSDPTSTLLQPHGYIIIWCDKLDPVSQLHATFKLEASGGTVTLMAADKSWKDQMTYSPHNGDETVGRYPDGADQVYLMNTPTIAKANRYTSYLSEVDQSTDGIDYSRLISDNNGLKVRYSKPDIIVHSENTGSGRLTVYTLSGQQRSQTPLTFTGGAVRVDVSNLPQGVYIARVVDDEDNAAACKFIIQ